MKFLFFSLSSKGEEQNKGKVASVEKLIKFWNWLRLVVDRGPFFNFVPRGKLWPKGRRCPLGPKLSPWGEMIYSPLHSSKQYVESFHPCGWTFPLGDKFYPWGPGVKLTMALRATRGLF
jgi:hypothetical protein